MTFAIDGACVVSACNYSLKGLTIALLFDNRTIVRYAKQLSVRPKMESMVPRIATCAATSAMNTPNPRPHHRDDKEFMTTLAKGLAVLGAFGRERPTMTLSEAAQIAALSRAAARRVLRTLTALGYVEQDGHVFSLSPRSVEFGFAYLSTQSWVDRATPLMRELSERIEESCSAAILQGTEIVYVARITARRIMSTALAVGSRLPAFHTALGRIQLGFVDEAEIWRRLMSLRIDPYTPYTITDVHALFDRVREDQEQGFSIVDEELERGLRSIAVPVRDRSGQVIAAINLSTHTTRTTRNEMRDKFLPELKQIAQHLSASTVSA
jgi:IclR family transcriptional regulator, pca regulon regulatory protein